MNKETLTGSCDSKGLFKAKNPYTFATYDRTEAVNANNFRDAHPELFCYTPSNELVISRDNVEVTGPVFQMRMWGLDVYTEWKEISQIAYLGINPRGKDQTRAIYIAVQPTEKADHTLYEYYEKPTGKWWPCNMGLSAFKLQGIEVRLKAPLPEAQPLEGVKTAEGHIIPHGKKRIDFTLEDWREVALECEAICSHQSISIIELYEKLESKANSQFTTDARGGKEPPLWYDEISLTNYLQNKHYHKGIITELVKDYAENLQQAFKKGWEKGYNDIQNNGTWDYVYYRPENTSAPSTHSSSEMVEGWISVKDKYPPIGEMALVYRPDDTQDIYFVDGIRAKWFTHWMPLPPTPKS